MSTTGFVPLHVHSHYSLLEGVDSIEVLLRRAADCNYLALALTDTNNLHGALTFAEAARTFGVRPILGTCLRSGPFRCTALIAEPAGYRSLCRVLSRLSASSGTSLTTLLAGNAEGLQLLVDDERLLKPLGEPFQGRLWLEIVRPGRSAAQERALLEAGECLGIKPVASCAPHFATAQGHDIFRLLAAVRKGMPLDQAPTGPITPAHHLASAEEVHERFRDLPEAVVNAGRLAEYCRSDVLPRGQVLPPTQLAPGQDAIAHLRLLCERGLPRRQSGDERAALLRLDQELAVIRQRDLEAYFLAVHEIAQEARRQDIPMALRGSAGNSLVCHLLGITDVDPLRFGLRFERFLHAGRPDLPDIDLDFDAKARGRVVAAVVARFGADRCARVGCLQTLQPRSAFRAAARAHGLSTVQVGQLLVCLAGSLEALREDPLPDCLTRLPQGLPLGSEEWGRLLADARLLLGRPSELSAHPSGILLTPGPAEDYLPLQRKGRGVGTAQFDKDGVERIGLVKIDLLSNRALSVVAEARERLAAQGGETAAYPEDDTDLVTLALLQRGDTLGVGQLETHSMRLLLRQMQPKGLEDLVQALGLLRPGAASGGAREAFLRRRRGDEPVCYEHPALEAILRETCGVMLFEDDCLLVVQALTGLPAPDADRLRRQLCRPETVAAAAALLLATCQQQGVPRDAGEKVCIQLTRFSAYAFCKSHAVSYGLIAWQAAYLKAHHPLCFWAAVLNNNQGTYPRRVYVEAAKRAGISVLLPCVNRSARTFSQEVSGLRTGLSAIRGLGEAAVTALLEERERLGPFQSLADFRRRVTVALEDLAKLIRVGAFDFSGRGRLALLREAGVEGHRVGRLPSASGGEEAVEVWPSDWLAGYPLASQWRDEWDLLGFLAGLPLMHLCRPSLPPGLADSRALGALFGRKVCLAGLVAADWPAPVECAAGKHFITLEDEWGLVDVTASPGACEQLPLRMGPWLVKGTVESRHGVPAVMASRLERVSPNEPLQSTRRPGAAETRANGTCRLP